MLTTEDLPPEVTGQASGSTVSPFGGESDSTPMVALGDTAGMSLREALEAPERQIILQALRTHNWNRAATADALDINRTTLYKKMKRLGLDDPRLQFA